LNFFGKGCKRLLSFVMTVIVLITIISVAVVPVSAASYDPAASLAYAKAHWNDGKGECAEFVRDCLLAGGLTGLTSINCRGLRNQIVDNNYGTQQKLTPTNGKFLYSVNRDVIAAGDPIIWYCSTCAIYPHIVLCGGYNKSGYLTYYSHNNAHNNDTLYFDLGSSSHRGHSFTVYSLHMNSAGNYPLSSYIYSTYTVIAEEGTALRSAPYAEIEGKDTAVITSAKGTKMIIVGSHVNENGVTYYKTESDYWVLASDVEKSDDLDSLSISGETKPADMKKGSSFSIKGTVKSASSPITSLTVGVYFTDGTAATEKTVLPDTPTYSLTSVDKDIKFGSLLTGSYIYKVTAKNAIAEKVVVQQEFKVLPTGYVTVSFDAAGGVSNVTSATAVQGEMLAEIPTATREGYVFEGWYTSDGEKVTAATCFNQNCTVTAYWTVEGAAIPDENLKLTIDEYMYSSATVTADESMIRYQPYPVYYGEDTAVRLAKSGQEIVVTGVCENSYGENWYLLDDYTWILADDVRIDKNLDSLSVSGENYPEKLVKGKSFSISGTVTSAVTDITSLTVGVYKADGTAVTSKTVSPNAETYDIKNVDAYIKFGSVPVGVYNYRITAKNLLGEVTLVDREYAVVTSLTATVTVTFDAAGGECGTTTLSVAQCESISEMPVATRVGYDFVGWFDASGKQITTADRLTADVKLTAKWEQLKNNGVTAEQLAWAVDGYVYAKYSAAAQSATVRNVPYAEYFNTVTEVGTISGDETVTVVASCTNYYGEKWLKTTDGNWIRESECKKVEDLVPFTLSDDVNYPEKLHLSYTACKLVGTIRSIDTNITSVNGGIFDLNGNRIYGKTISPNATSFSIKSIDDYIAFRSLGKGEYYYRVTVTNAYGTYNVIDYAFTVVDKLPTFFTVTFNPAGGLCDTETLSVMEGATISNLPTPTRDGYEFVGWFAADGNEITAETVVSSNITALALWTEISPEQIVGDVDGNNILDTADLILFQQHLFGLTSLESGPDFNGDGVVNSSDLAIMQFLILGIG